MSKLRDMNLCIPCRKSIGNISRPRAGEAVAAMRKRARQFLLDEMKRPMVLGKALCLSSGLPNSKHGGLDIRWHLGTFPIHYRFLRRVGLKRLRDHMEF